jgi:antitoxin VapB
MKTLTNPNLLATAPIFAPIDAMLRGVAKVFMTGRSQAIRLPKEFRFDSKEVTIEKHGDAIVLRPKVQTKDEWWAEMEDILNGFEGMPLEIERNHSDLSEPVNFDFSGAQQI